MMAPRGVGVLFTMWLAGRLMGKVDTRIMIAIGLLLFAWSLHRWRVGRSTWTTARC